MSLLKNKKILVTGGAGFLGSFVVAKLLERGVSKEDIFVPRSKDLDLRKESDCQKAVEGKDLVIHLAAKVGGIGYNKEHPAETFYDNAAMALNLIDSSHKAGVEKFVGVGSVCSYPKVVPMPFREDDLWSGYPEETNAPYGLAKKMMLVQSQAYRQQYGFNAIHLLMINLYGPGDNFDEKSSHVIPAIIKKVNAAKQAGKDFIEAWGTGIATREFLYAEDAAEGILLAAENYNKSEPVNLGSGMEISIKDLTETICRLMDFKGEIRWDSTKPDGQLRRMLDVSRAENEFGFKAKINFEEGLKNTINRYLKNN